jgi:ADP-ribose pyrophosphatase YjhB (NUDIX family)
LEECAKRELREETGIEAKYAEQFAYVEQPINISNTHYLHFGYLASNFDDNVLKNGEPEYIERWEWFDLQKIPHNLAGYQREIIIKFLKLKGIGFGKK